MSPIIYTYWNGWMSVVENIMYLRRYLETLFKMLEDLGEGKKCPLSLHSHAPRVKNCNRKSYLQVSLLLILNYVYLRNLLALVLKKKKLKEDDCLREGYIFPVTVFSIVAVSVMIHTHPISNLPHATVCMYLHYWGVTTIKNTNVRWKADGTWQMKKNK